MVMVMVAWERFVQINEVLKCPFYIKNTNRGKWDQWPHLLFHISNLNSCFHCRGAVWAGGLCRVPWLLTGSPQLGDTRHMTRLYIHPYITASHSTHVTPCVPTSPSSIYPHTSIRHLDTNISHPCMLRFRKLLFVIWAEENSWNKCLHLHKLEGSKMQNKHEINVTFISGRTHLPHAVTVGITDTIKNTRQASK